MSVEVEQGDWLRHERTGYTEDLCITGLGPCTGVVVVDRESGVAFGAHLTSPDQHEVDVLDKMLNAAAEEFRDGANAEVTLSGCCAEHNENWKAVRKFVEERVGEVLPRALVLPRWPEE